MLNSVKKRFPGAYGWYCQLAKARQQALRKAAVELILAAPRPTKPIDEESVLEGLMARPFPAPTPYKYDDLSLWLRAASRVTRLAQLGALTTQRHRILEICGGDGMVSRLLADLGHDVQMLDQADWRSPRATGVSFVQCDVDVGLPFQDGAFDLLLSYNAFEHVKHPDRVLAEMMRVCRPGGKLLIDFGPLYASPFGIHAWNLRLPWPQFLLSPRLLELAIRSEALSDLGTSQDNLQATNGWEIAQFRKLWATSGCIVEHLFEDEDHRFLDLVTEFPSAFHGRSLSFEDLVKNSIEVLLSRPVDD
jgi:SAM-dependent methyltransferase